MKISEAEKKVCPFTVQYGGAPSSKDVGGFGLHVGDMLASKCICGDCMAWVYTKQSVSFINGEVNCYSDKRGERILGVDEKEGYCARIGQYTNEALIRATSVSQLNEAVKNTPLPPLKE